MTSVSIENRRRRGSRSATIRALKPVWKSMHGSASACEQPSEDSAPELGRFAAFEPPSAGAPLRRSAGGCETGAFTEMPEYLAVTPLRRDALSGPVANR